MATSCGELRVRTNYGWRFQEKPWTLEELAAFATVLKRQGEDVAREIRGRGESLEEFEKLLRSSSQVVFKSGDGTVPFAALTICEDTEVPAGFIHILNADGKVIRAVAVVKS